MKSLSLSSAVILFLLFIGCSTKKEQRAAQPAPVAEVNDLPAVTLIESDGKKLSARNLPGNTILIFFGATCDHCQREAAQIRDNLKGFQAYTLYFIAMDPFPVIDKFADDYGISHQPNIRFMRADAATVSIALGYLKTPTLFVYSGNRKLIKRFDGETNVKEILRVL